VKPQIRTICTMSLLLSPRSAYSLFPSCSDPLPKPCADSSPSRRSSRRVILSRHATDRSSGDRSKANGDIAESPVRMGGRLIPLRLQYEEIQPQSASFSTITNPSVQSTSPATPRKRRPGPVTDLIIVPHTDNEWKVVMEEVKILYLKGQYKHCSTRCKQILDGIAVGPIQERVRSVKLTTCRTKHIPCIPSISASSLQAP